MQVQVLPQEKSRTGIWSDLRTTNGGLVWDSVYGGEHLLRGISFTSAATGYAVGNTGTILKSTNERDKLVFTE